MPWKGVEGKLNENTYLIDAIQGGQEKSMGCYVLKGTKKQALIDTSGPHEAINVVEKLKNMNLRPDILLLTHAHWDHAAGTPIIRGEFPSIEVMIGSSGVKSLENNSKFNKAFLDIVPDLNPIENVIPLKEGDTIDLGSLELHVIETPGHSDCSISFLDQKNKTLFVGDALGYLWTKNLVMPPIMPPEFSQEKLLSTFDKIENMCYLSIGLAHFGLLTEEKAQNFLDLAKEFYTYWRDFLTSAWKEQPIQEYVIDQFIKNLNEMGIYDPGGQISHRMIGSWMIQGLKSASLISNT